MNAVDFVQYLGFCRFRYTCGRELFQSDAAQAYLPQQHRLEKVRAGTQIAAAAE